MGANARIGTEFAAMANGIMVSLAIVQRAVIRATPIPAVQPMSRPPRFFGREPANAD